MSELITASSLATGFDHSCFWWACALPVSHDADILEEIGGGLVNTLVIAVIAATSVWVYLDATGNRIGKIPGEAGMFNMSAGAWAVVTLLLWVVGFPAYLVKRRALIAKASASPVEANGRQLKAAVLGAVGGLWVSLTFQSAALPACESVEVHSLLGTIVGNMPLVKVTGAEFITVRDVREQGYNSQAEVRTCEGTLVTTMGQDRLQYQIRWQDGAKSTFYVQAQIVPLPAQGEAKVVSSPDAPPSPPAQEPAPEAYLAVTPDILVKSATDNELAFKQDFDGQYVHLLAEVQNVSIEGGVPVIKFATASVTLMRVLCPVRNEDAKAASSLRPEQVLEVWGRLRLESRITTTVHLDGCRFAPFGGDAVEEIRRRIFRFVDQGQIEKVGVPVLGRGHIVEEELSLESEPNSAPSSRSRAPLHAVVREFEQSDSACWVNLTDASGKELTEAVNCKLSDEKWIGAEVIATYGKGQVLAPSCQGDPECDALETIDLIESFAAKSSPASSTPSPPTSPVERAYVNTLRLNVRAGPTSDEGVVAKLAFGTQCDVAERREGWAKVTCAQQTGWVSAEFIVPNAPEPEPLFRLVADDSLGTKDRLDAALKLLVLQGLDPQESTAETATSLFLDKELALAGELGKKRPFNSCLPNEDAKACIRRIAKVTSESSVSLRGSSFLVASLDSGELSVVRGVMDERGVSVGGRATYSTTPELRLIFTRIRTLSESQQELPTR